MKNIKFRKNIEKLQWYSSWKSEYTWAAEIFLDTNENPYDVSWDWYNRYPDPLQVELKKEILLMKNEESWMELVLDNIMIDSWSDSIIDLLVRMFCEPWIDSLGFFSPTFWMYRVAADINNVWIKEFLLDNDFKIKNEDIESLGTSISTSEWLKLLFICNPNNPSWNTTVHLWQIREILEKFQWVVVVDEAYIDFCLEESCESLLKNYDNLVIIQTFSKLWGLAWIRCGLALSSAKIIETLNTIKAPYNVSTFTQEVVVKQLKNRDVIFGIRNKIIEEREKMRISLSELEYVIAVYPSQANFLLVKFMRAEKVYIYLRGNWIIVRSFSWKDVINNCLRITVWTPDENKKVLKMLEKFTY